MSGRPDQLGIYEIRLRGKLDQTWSDWLGSVTIAFEDDPDGPGFTTLTGRLDQAALHGVLTRICYLNLTVTSVDQMESTAL